MADIYNEGETVSMLDVLEEDAALEDEANAVLGASDDTNCTYPLGYMDRQALYACLTCTPIGSASAGVCFACCLHCHDSHELVELYTKRNFRCDCGNSKFKDFSCKVYKDKESVNEKNEYNQNFTGVYCTCERPYPDPEDEIEDEMIQCIVCEDWYHSRHLGTLPPADYDEMVCDSCMRKLEFLKHYRPVSVSGGKMSPSKQQIKKEETDKNIDVTTTEDQSSSIPSSTTSADDTSERSVKDQSSDSSRPSQKKVGDGDDAAKQSTTESNGHQSTPSCKLQALEESNAKNQFIDAAAFWINGWRSQLCKCQSCLELYEKLGVPFIVNEDDTIHSYETKGKTKAISEGTSYDTAMKALGNMNRVQQVEALTEFNNLKSELTDYLKTFAGQGKVVRKEDIEEFFSDLKEKKRRRLDNQPSIPFNCR